jgi:hypothetical protein
MALLALIRVLLKIATAGDIGKLTDHVNVDLKDVDLKDIVRTVIFFKLDGYLDKDCRSRIDDPLALHPSAPI